MKTESFKSRIRSEQGIEYHNNDSLLRLTPQSLLSYERLDQTCYCIEVPFLDKPAVYRIKVRGVVPERCVDRLGGMEIVSVTSASTTLEGWLPDQAALSGVLESLYALHLPLLKVICLPPPGKHMKREKKHT